MIEVHYPVPDFKIKNMNGVDYIFDTIRKKWIVITPEEWVRQNMILFFTEVCGYPKNHIAVEKQISLIGRKKRFDIVIYNSRQQPWMLVECKQPNVLINDDIMMQVRSYQSILQADFLAISTGEICYLFELKDKSEKTLSLWPEWC